MDEKKVVSYYDQKWAQPSAAKGVSATLRQRRIISLIRKHKNTADLSILDLGCGKGYLSKELSQFGQVTGVDYAEKTIRANRTRIPQVTFVCADVTSPILPQILEQYDLIISSEVIEHIPVEKRTRFLENVASMLRKKGIFIVTTPFREGLLKLKPAHVSEEEFLTGIDDQPIDNIMSKSELLTILDGHFTVLEFTSVQPPVRNRILDLLWKVLFLPVDYRFVNIITEFLRLDGKYMVVVCAKR